MKMLVECEGTVQTEASGSFIVDVPDDTDPDELTEAVLDDLGELGSWETEEGDVELSSADVIGPAEGTPDLILVRYEDGELVPGVKSEPNLKIVK